MSADKNELLKKALLEAREKEFENIPAEDELKEEHVFSMDFEKKMHDLTKKNKVSGTISRLGRYAAGFAIVCVLTGAAFMIINRGDLSFKKAADSSMAEGSYEIAEGIVNEEVQADENKAASSSNENKEATYTKDDNIYYGANIGNEAENADAQAEQLGDITGEEKYAAYTLTTDGMECYIYEEEDRDVIEVLFDNGDITSAQVKSATIGTVSIDMIEVVYNYGDESEDYDIVVGDNSIKYYLVKQRQLPDGGFSGIPTALITLDAGDISYRLLFVRNDEGKFVYNESW